MITPDERSQILDLVRRHQRDGSVYGWALDEDRREVQLYIPQDSDPSGLPDLIGTIGVVVVPIPRAEEL